MEPQAKRQRTGWSSPGDKIELIAGDELNYQPDEINRLRDPAYQLQKARSFAILKLKSRFEHIFEKYERDFIDSGDEIQLSTMKITVNNGHLDSLPDSRFDGGSETDEIGETGHQARELWSEERQFHHSQREDSLHVLKHDATFTMLHAGSDTSPLLTGIPKLDESDQYSPWRSSGITAQKSVSSNMDERLDPAWKVPELPTPSFGLGIRPGTTSGTHRRRVRLALPKSGNTGNPEEDFDDIILGPMRYGKSMTVDQAEDNLENIPVFQVVQDQSNTVNEKSEQLDTEGPEDRRKTIDPEPGNAVDLYVDYTSADGKLISKPKNQMLEVEIFLKGANSLVQIQTMVPESSLRDSAVDKTGEPKAFDVAKSVEKAAMRLAGSSQPLDPNPEVRVPTSELAIEGDSGRKALGQEHTISEEGSWLAQDIPKVPLEESPDSSGPRQHAQGSGAKPDTPLMGESTRNTLPEGVGLNGENIIDSAYTFSDDDEPAMPKSRLGRIRLSNQTAGVGKKLPLELSESGRGDVLKMGSQCQLLDLKQVAGACLPANNEAQPVSWNVPIASKQTSATLLIQHKPKQTRASRKSKRILTKQDGVCLLQAAEYLHQANRMPTAQDSNASDPPSSRTRYGGRLLQAIETGSSSVTEEGKFIVDDANTSPKAPIPAPRSSKVSMLHAYRGHTRPTPSPEVHGVHTADSSTSSKAKDTCADEEARAPTPHPVQAPKTPSRRKPEGRPGSRLRTPSTLRSSILTLVSDDEDELSLGPEALTSSGKRRQPDDTLPRLSFATRFGSGGTLAMQRRAKLLPHDRGHSRTPSTGPFWSGRKARTSSGGKAKWKAGRVSGVSIGLGRLPSPGTEIWSEVNESPGESRRRCGQDGFHCHRDFCFVCL